MWLLWGSAVRWVAVALLLSTMFIEVGYRVLSTFRIHADWLEARREHRRGGGRHRRW